MPDDRPYRPRPGFIQPPPAPRPKVNVGIENTDPVEREVQARRAIARLARGLDLEQLGVKVNDVTDAVMETGTQKIVVFLADGRRIVFDSIKRLDIDKVIGTGYEVSFWTDSFEMREPTNKNGEPIEQPKKTPFAKAEILMPNRVIDLDDPDDDEDDAPFDGMADMLDKDVSVRDRAIDRLKTGIFKTELDAQQAMKDIDALLKKYDEINEKMGRRKKRDG